MVGASTPMSRLDDLPQDQRATLSLLLRQRKDYAEVASLLGIEQRAVHDRAHAALAVLAPREARQLSAERREEIGEYLLGQQASMGGRLRTRTHLEGSAPARAWARALAAELAPLAVVRLPEIPGPPATRAATVEGGERAPAAKRTGRGAARSTRASLPSSRVGGALLLGAILAGVIVAVILLAGGGGSSQGRTAASPARAATGATGPGASSATKPIENKRITLTPTNPHSNAIGVAEVLSEGNKYAFFLAAEHLAPSSGFFYAVWLYNSPTSHEPVSRGPNVAANGRLQGGALLPADAGRYHTMLLTKETSTAPTHPGPVVLRGPFALH
jgi:hypothetical protein